MTRRGTRCKIQNPKKKDPADKAVARIITYATSCFGTRAIPLLRSFFRALQSSSKVWLMDISFSVGASPDNPHSTLADRGSGSIAYSIDSGSAPRCNLVGQPGIRVSTCHRPGGCSFPWDLLIFAAPRSSSILHF